MSGQISNLRERMGSGASIISRLPNTLSRAMNSPKHGTADTPPGQLSKDYVNAIIEVMIHDVFPCPEGPDQMYLNDRNFHESAKTKFFAGINFCEFKEKEVFQFFSYITFLPAKISIIKVSVISPLS